MSENIRESINKIKISISENDQELWECQASAKCYKEATAKLEEKCKYLTKDIARINEEIRELDPQVQITAECYDVHVESIALIPESLINQGFYTKCVIENNKKHQEEMDRTVDRYAKYIQSCKEKLERTNPTYKLLLTKKNELKCCKIRCLELQQKISSREKINKQKTEIRQKLFYADFVAFAQAWVNHKKYLETLRELKEETMKEQEYTQKLAEVSELLKQKQKQAMFKIEIPQIEFPDKVNDNNRQILDRAVKNYDEGNNLGKTQINSCLSELKTMLENKDADILQPKRPANMSDSQKLEIKAGSSKVKILENKALKTPQNAPKTPLKVQSKEERSKMIDAKIKKALDNFRRSISPRNSKQQINLSQKSIQGKSNLNALEKKPSQQSKCSQESNSSKMIVEPNSPSKPYGGSGATQELEKLNISRENNLNGLPKNSSQTSKNPRNPGSQETNPYYRQNVQVSTKMDKPVNKPNLQTNRLKKKLSQEIKFPRTVSFMLQSNVEGDNIPLHTPEFGQSNTQTSTGRSTKENNVCTAPAKKPRTSAVVEKPQAISAVFNGTLLNTGNKEPDDARSATETPIEDSRYFFNMGGFNFGKNNQFSQMLNETERSDLFDEGFKSPDQTCQFSPTGSEGNNISSNNFGLSNSAATPLFSFGQSSDPFSFI